MKEVRNGIKQDIRKVLGELTYNRFEGCSQPYKNITDSLRKLIDIETSYTVDPKEKGFYKCLLVDLETEATEVQRIANITLDNKRYKEYREWLESLRRLISIHQEIGYIVKGLYKEEGIRNSLPQFKDK